ncbi:hypothetical protein AM499_08915 [Bacillus sp. FJAT-22090]|uniref:lantibiotic dehydratase n=1 Tax=Bacillus sp. FJAT-22090 TaxID=1581038 RepID=UPI0006AEDAF2|nr:lantibiotic dehydratase [Bacillus sp. FJAT-22090]ALC85932.1 hypothetical protein AM499_08915 [Bacillus sp. FJAT-22090]
MKATDLLCEYKIHETFLLRTPLFPIDNLKKLLTSRMDDNEIYDFFLSNKIFEEALLVSSIDTYKMLYMTKSRKPQLLQTLIKYYNRMSTRSTPYGLTAGVSIGKFGNDDRTDIHINELQKYEKHVRVDFEWCCNLIRLIESNISLRENLMIKVNPSCYRQGDRLINPYLSIYHLHNDKNSNRSSIRFTKAVQLVMEYCTDFVGIKDVKLYLKSLYPDAGRDKINGLIDSLIKNEFLFTNLRFSTSCDDPLAHILSVLCVNGVSENIYYKLNEISRKIKEYCLCEIGEGIQIYLDICEKMKDIYETKNYLQVDLTKSVYSNKISKSFKNNLEESINFLLTLAPKKNISHIEIFKNNFLEKYGMHDEIALIEVLDENIGLGIPNEYKINTQDNEKNSNAKMLSFQKLLNRRFRNNINEIKLTKKDLLDISDNDFTLIENDSFDIYMEMIKDGEKNDEYDIALLGVTSNAGQALGRFLPFIDDESISENIFKETCSNTTSLVAEINEYPSNSRFGNVSLNKNPFDYSISISSYNDNKFDIPLTDLYVGIDKNTQNLYVKSKTLNKRIVAIKTNMLNELYFSKFSRFLYDLTYFEQKSLNYILSQFHIPNSMYVPRISYKNIILKSATWQVEEKELERFAEKKNWGEDDFIKFCNFNNIPKVFFVLDFDKKLLIDLENIHLSKLVTNILKSKKNIVLVESLQDLNNLFVYDSNHNKYLNEIIVSFSKNSELYPNEFLYDQKILPNYNLFQERYNQSFMFGESGWIYLKLYGCRGREEELIGRYIKFFCTELYEDKGLKKHFFIRYYDPEPHIRLRLQFYNQPDDKIIERLNAWLRLLRDNGLITKGIYDTYEPEITRYGGFELIQKAEDVFCADSIVIENILYGLSNKTIANSDLYLGILNVLAILDVLEPNTQRQLEMLQASGNPSDYREVFKENRKEIIRLVSRDKSLLSKDELNILHIFKQRNIILNEYKDKILKVEAKGNLKNEINDIILSIIHMSCNRFKADNTWEKKIISLVRHGIYANLEKRRALSAKYGGRGND